MDYFLKEYKQKCKQEFGQYGFKAYRNNHYRVVNDVFQSFSLHRSVSGLDATVEFGIVPLGVDYDLDKSFVNPYHLKQFENRGGWFEYNRNSSASISACINEMIGYIKTYLMPLFEQAIDCQSAYEVMCKNNNIFTGNSIEKFCMCLKFGDYARAKFYIEEVISQYKYAYARNREILGSDIPQDYIQKMEKEIFELRNLQSWVIDEKRNDINKWLGTNEKRNKENLGCKS